MIDKLRQVPPSTWIVLTIMAGITALAWHAFSQDPDDGDWTRPAEVQPPTMAPYPCTPCVSTISRPMDVGVAFRSRAYADDLTSAGFSFIGGIDVG